MTKPVHKHISGHWNIHRVRLCRGGPEEGGWWYEAGDLVATIPGTREFLVNEHWDDDRYSYDIVHVLDDTPELVLNMMLFLVQEDYGEFDDEFRSCAPRHDSLKLTWNESIVHYYPEERPRYE